MTYAPADLEKVRDYLFSKFHAEIGIVGDPAHAASGGYHEGNDDLSRVGRLTSDYSKRESARDRPGSNAASALDIGTFTVTINGRTVTWHSLTLALVDACKRGDPRTRDIREVIYTPDGSTVSRWDRLGIRSTGDDSHLYHTHISFFRDSEGRRNALDNILGLLIELIEGVVHMARDYAPYSVPAPVADRPDSVLLADGWGQEMLETSPYATGAPSARTKRLMRIEDGVAALKAAADADKVRDDAVLAAVKALATAGGVDSAPIVSAVNAVRDEARQQFAALGQALAAETAARQAAEAEAAHLRAQLAAAYAAN